MSRQHLWPSLASVAARVGLAVALVATGAACSDDGSLGPPEAGVVLNEIVCKAIPDGGFNPIGSDWVELHNTGVEALEVGGARLIDSKSKPFVEATPLPGNLTIPAGGYLVVFFNSEGFGTPRVEKGLGSSEVVTLFASDGTLLDQLDWKEGDCPEGGSWGRSPDGGSALRTFDEPTPNAANP